LGRLRSAFLKRGWSFVGRAFAFLSNHYHLLVWVKDAQQLGGLMNLFNSKLAREVGRLTGWREKIWSRRYQSIVVSSEEAAQVERLRYVLAHGVKEGLVERVQEWPGVHAAQALLEGTSLEGLWFDRTQECSARRRGEDFDRLKFATPETVTLSPLPCWENLSPGTWRESVAGLIAEIEAAAAAERSRTGVQPLGRAAIFKQRYEDRPNQPKKSCSPWFHAASRRVRKELYEAYAWFVSAYREAAEKLRSGDRTAIFPAGSFPPALPFVPT
jgi:Transposase IS200 like